MILIIAGTKDGRQLAVQLAQAGYKVIVSVISEHGRTLAEQSNLIVYSNKLDKNDMISFVREHRIRLIIDASHPYAVNVSENAIAACRFLGIKYLRYERPASDLSSFKNIFIVKNYQDAACKAAFLGKTVFLTTGSRTLDIFKKEPTLKNHRIIARVLPDPDVINKCIEQGFSLSDIIALQGPFSHQFNLVMFKDYNAEVIVMKNSGHIGGSDTKLSAAAELNLPVIVVDRPAVNYGKLLDKFNDVLMFVEEVFK